MIFNTKDENDVTKTLFLNLIRQGIGFSLSCSKLSIDIMQASIEYLKDAELKSEIDNAFKLGLIDIITEKEKVLKDQENKYHLAELNQMILAFISKPCLWCSGLNKFQLEALKEDGYLYISSEMILQGISTYGNIQEVATAYGQTYQEILEVVCSDPKLRYLANPKKSSSWEK